MRKIYLKNSEKCPVCGTNSKSFIITDNGNMCPKCFISSSQKEFTLKHPNNRRYGKHKPFAKRKAKCIGKKIYAINGITSLVRGGCTN